MEQFLEFVSPVINFMDSLWGVYFISFFAFLGILYQSKQNKKLSKECHKLSIRVIELENEKAEKNGQ